MAVPSLQSQPDEPLAVRYWRAVAELPVDRRRALCELEACFSHGGVPEGMEGDLAGRLIATTIGSGIDLAIEAATRAWMPWRGKTFSPQTTDGRNLFVRSWRPLQRMTWPGYRDIRDEPNGRMSTFRFLTWEGPSATSPDVQVLKIDYGHPESPSFLIRSILDELVQIDDGLFLGQALLDWRGRLRRAAWFSLSR